MHEKKEHGINIIWAALSSDGRKWTKCQIMIS